MEVRLDNPLQADVALSVCASSPTLVLALVLGCSHDNDSTQCSVLFVQIVYDDGDEEVCALAIDGDKVQLWVAEHEQLVGPTAEHLTAVSQHLLEQADAQEAAAVAASKTSGARALRADPKLLRRGGWVHGGSPAEHSRQC